MLNCGNESYFHSFPLYLGGNFILFLICINGIFYIFFKIMIVCLLSPPDPPTQHHPLSSLPFPKQHRAAPHPASPARGPPRPSALSVVLVYSSVSVADLGAYTGWLWALALALWVLTWQEFWIVLSVTSGDSWWVLPPLWNRIALSIFILPFYFKTFKLWSQLPQQRPGLGDCLVECRGKRSVCLEQLIRLLVLKQRRGREVPERPCFPKTLSQLLPYERERDLEKSYNVSLALHGRVWVEGKF